MSRQVLILGGGVAGCSCAYFLHQKGYEVTIVNKDDRLGGLARTETYGGHPYEFGPHIWFWPGGLDAPINKAIHDLTDGRLFTVDRKLFSYIEADQSYYRYPVHFDDIAEMPEKDAIKAELRAHRDQEWKLQPEGLPVIGEATFEEYFSAAIGTTLYNKFMNNYSAKMWNIPGSELETSMVWADRLAKDADASADEKWLYDPLKFESHTLGQGINFQVYPMDGWNRVWGGMASEAHVLQDRVVRIEKVGASARIYGELHEWSTGDFDLIVNTLDLDHFFGDSTLPYTGRLMLPLVVPGREFVFPEEAESFHYSGAEFMTRVTEMKRITHHESTDSLLLIEVPVLPGASQVLPDNVRQQAEKKNLFAEKAYPQQSKAAISFHESLEVESREISGWHNVGRHAQFKYWGMAETVQSAYDFAETC